MNSILNRESLRVEIVTLDDNTKGIFIPLETAAKIFNLLPVNDFGIITNDVKEELNISLSDSFISSLETFISHPYELYKTSRYIGVRSKPKNPNYRKKTGIYAIYNSNKKELSLSTHSSIMEYDDVSPNEFEPDGSRSTTRKNIISQFYWVKDVVAHDGQDPKILRNSMNKNDVPNVIYDFFQGYIPSEKRNNFFSFLKSYIQESVPELYKNFVSYLTTEDNDIFKIMSKKLDQQIKLASSQSLSWWQGKQNYEDALALAWEEWREANPDLFDRMEGNYFYYNQYGEYLGLWNCYEEWVEDPYLDYQPFFKKMVEEEIIYAIDTDSRFQGTSRLIFRDVTDVENFIDDIQDGLDKFFDEAS